MSFFDQPEPRPGAQQGSRRRRRRNVVENDDFAAFVRRIIVAYGRRVATGDVEALADLIRLGADIEAATDEAIAGLRRHGYSWAEIGSRIGVSRQAAQQRWGGER